MNGQIQQEDGLMKLDQFKIPPDKTPLELHSVTGTDDSCGAAVVSVLTGMATQFAMIRVRESSRFVHTRNRMGQAAGVNFNEYKSVMENGFGFKTSEVENVANKKNTVFPDLPELMGIAPNGTYIVSRTTRQLEGRHVVVVQKIADKKFICADNGHTFTKKPSTYTKLPSLYVSRIIRILNKDANVQSKQEPVTMAARKTKPRNRQSGLKPFVRKVMRRRKRINAQEMHDLALQEGIESPIASIRSTMWQVQKEMDEGTGPAPRRGRKPASKPASTATRRGRPRKNADDNPEPQLRKREVKRKERKNTLKYLVKQTLKSNPQITVDDMHTIAKEKGFDSPLSSLRGVLWTVRKDEGIEVNGRGGNNNNEPEAPQVPEETQEAREARIADRFATLERLATRIAENKIPSMIVSGPPGLGKSFTLEQKVREVQRKGRRATIVSGTISATGLYRLLFEHRNGGILVFDDADDVFDDKTCLNLLKAVLDSNSERIVSYIKDAKWMKEEDIPNSFEFCGSVAFCTNIDFEREIQRSNAKAVHFQALMDRSLYLTLTLRGSADHMTRIRQVALDEQPDGENGTRPGLIKQLGLNEEQGKEIMEYLAENQDRFYVFSIRTLLQVAHCMNANPETWRRDADATQIRTI